MPSNYGLISHFTCLLYLPYLGKLSDRKKCKISCKEHTLPWTKLTAICVFITFSAYSLSNKCAKVYWNRTTTVEAIDGGWVVAYTFFATLCIRTFKHLISYFIIYKFMPIVETFSLLIGALLLHNREKIHHSRAAFTHKTRTPACCRFCSGAALLRHL